MKLGILRETKVPPDRRVPLTPDQCSFLLKEYEDIDIVVQPDEYRAFSNDEYQHKGITLNDDLSDCDILMGVKEVKLSSLISEKTYLFFSHTAKKQSYNRKLLQTVIEKKIRLIDYEYLTNEENVRVVAFGHWAGIVGAYNGLKTYGIRSKLYELKPAWKCRDHEELFLELKKVKCGNIKVVITGGGRVASGAMEIFSSAGFKKVSPEDFLIKKYSYPVCTQLDPWYYVKRLDGQSFDLHHFYNFPEDYETIFLPFTKVADMYVPCHYWDPRSPVFITRDDMRRKDFKIKVIADVSCDINGPVPSTIRSSTIADPVYGYDPQNEMESAPYLLGNISVMAVDNLPGELPRDASTDFGDKLVTDVIPYLIGEKHGDIIERATITDHGRLSKHFTYLEDYLNGVE